VDVKHHLITGHVGPTQELLVDVKHHLITGHVGPTQALLVDVKQNIHQCWPHTGTSGGCKTKHTSMLESINQVERVELLCEWSIDG